MSPIMRGGQVCVCVCVCVCVLGGGGSGGSPHDFLNGYRQKLAIWLVNNFGLDYSFCMTIIRFYTTTVLPSWIFVNFIEIY